MDATVDIVSRTQTHIGPVSGISQLFGAASSDNVFVSASTDGCLRITTVEDVLSSVSVPDFWPSGLPATGNALASTGLAVSSSLLPLMDVSIGESSCFDALGSQVKLAAVCCGGLNNKVDMYLSVTAEGQSQRKGQLFPVIAVDTGVPAVSIAVREVDSPRYDVKSGSCVWSVEVLFGGQTKQISSRFMHLELVLASSKVLSGSETEREGEGEGVVDDRQLKRQKVDTEAPSLLWSIKSCQTRLVGQRVFGGHDDCVRGCVVVVNMLVSVCDDGTARRYRVGGGVSMSDSVIMPIVSADACHSNDAVCLACCEAPGQGDVTNIKCFSVSGGKDGRIVVCDAENMHVLVSSEHPGVVKCIDIMQNIVFAGLSHGHAVIGVLSPPQLGSGLLTSAKRKKRAKKSKDVNLGSQSGWNWKYVTVKLSGVSACRIMSMEESVVSVMCGFESGELALCNITLPMSISISAATDTGTGMDIDT